LFLPSPHVGFDRFQFFHLLTVEVMAAIAPVSGRFLLVPAYSCFRNMRG
jgi:hypothetical protein